jgi:hypothetical protein
VASEVRISLSFSHVAAGVHSANCNTLGVSKRDHVQRDDDCRLTASAVLRFSLLISTLHRTIFDSCTRMPTLNRTEQTTRSIHREKFCRQSVRYSLYWILYLWDRRFLAHGLSIFPKRPFSD